MTNYFKFSTAYILYDMPREKYAFISVAIIGVLIILSSFLFPLAQAKVLGAQDYEITAEIVPDTVKIGQEFEIRGKIKKYNSQDTSDVAARTVNIIYGDKQVQTVSSVEPIKESWGVYAEYPEETFPDSWLPSDLGIDEPGTYEIIVQMDYANFISGEIKTTVELKVEKGETIPKPPNDPPKISSFIDNIDLKEAENIGIFGENETAGATFFLEAGDRPDHDVSGEDYERYYALIGIYSSGKDKIDSRGGSFEFNSETYKQSWLSVLEKYDTPDVYYVSIGVNQSWVFSDNSWDIESQDIMDEDIKVAYIPANEGNESDPIEKYQYQPNYILLSIGISMSIIGFLGYFIKEGYM